MADLKISQLTGASTPLAGTEVLPIVQSGSTVKVSVANLTAGRAVASAGGTFSDNFVQGTAAKGVNFTANTPAAGMTSQLLNWYEEGTWTPEIAGSGTSGTGTYNTQVGRYTRIGRIMQFQMALDWTNLTGATGILVINGLPFTSANVTGLTTAVTTIADNVAITAGYYMQNFIFANSTQIAVRQFPSGGGTAAAVGLLTSGSIFCTGSYTV